MAPDLAMTPGMAAAAARVPPGLVDAIRLGWSAATSADPGWTAACPAAGQCAVTALIVQDYLGGELVRGKVGAVSHYWNRLAGGDVDLTRSQFPRFRLTGAMTPGDRAYVLSFPGTAARYETLRRAVAAYCGEAIGARAS